MKGFALYRILGNDLPPRHCPEQTLKNLQFILAHESEFPDCEKRWVVNRIADREQEHKVLSLLQQYGQPYLHIPFVIEEYARCRYDIHGLPRERFLHNASAAAAADYLSTRAFEYPFRHKNLYAMNNNGARNAALAEGRSLAEWTLPWDGCCFMTRSAWAAMLHDMESLRGEKYLIVPMARVYDNRLLLDDGFAPAAEDEPQIAFHRDAAESFDATLRYGYNPKADLLRRLRVPGPWENWGNVPWEVQTATESPEAGKYRYAGWVARLFSGLQDVQDADSERHTHRMDGIVSKLTELDEQLLRRKFRCDDLVFYDAKVLAGYKQAWRTRRGRAADIVKRVVDHAVSALENGPWSVLDKSARPPSGDPHDYLSPAAYWSNDPDLPEASSERHDGERSAEAQLFSPESDRFDRTRWQRLIDNTTVLALAWYFTDAKRFAERAALLIRTWFLDPATRMNPHLKFAQIRIGEEAEQQGYGIIETKDFYYFLDAVRLVFRSGKLAASEQQQFKIWCQTFLDWMQRSPQGQAMFLAQNNQGTYYDLQLAALAAFVDDTRLLLWISRIAGMRRAQQFLPDGSQPEELTRTNSLHYSVFNLYGWFYLNRFAMLTDTDVWNAGAADGGSPAAGLKWLRSFGSGAWPYPQQDGFDFARLAVLRALAGSIHQDEDNGLDSVARADSGIEPVFHPYAGILPYWPLCLSARQP